MATALIIVTELAGAGFAIGVAAASPGFTTVVTGSVGGTSGTWEPAQSAAAVPEDALATDLATTPPDPTSDRSVDPVTPVGPEETSTSTPPDGDSSSPSEPQTTIRF